MSFMTPCASLHMKPTRRPKEPMGSANTGRPLDLNCSKSLRNVAGLLSLVWEISSCEKSWSWFSMKFCVAAVTCSRTARRWRERHSENWSIAVETSWNVRSLEKVWRLPIALATAAERAANSRPDDS